jgi:anti-sigma-K factor RskA
MSVSLILLIAAVALAAVVAAAIVSNRRHTDELLAERQMLPTRSTMIATYEYDESGKLTSVKTGPAESLGDQSPT